MRPLTIREMIAYTLYYGNPALYRRYARQDTEFMGWLADALAMPEHIKFTVDFGRN